MTRRPKEFSTSQAHSEFIRRWFWATFIGALVIVGLLFTCGVAAAQTPTERAIQEGRGGFIQDYPSWFVKVKSSETPFSGPDGVYEFVGSGTWIARDLVLTCWHNIRFQQSDRPSPEFGVVDHNGNRYDNVEIVAVRKQKDILVLRVKGDIITHNQVRISTDQDTNDVCFNYGLDPDGTRFRWSVGEVILGGGGKPKRQGSSNGQPYWHTHTGLVVPGMSGGPCFNGAGEQQGINVGHWKGVSSVVSLSEIQKVLDTIDLGDK